MQGIRICRVVGRSGRRSSLGVAHGVAAMVAAGGGACARARGAGVVGGSLVLAFSIYLYIYFGASRRV